MAFLRVTSWISANFTTQTKNEVTPIKIAVQPRSNENSSDTERKVDSNIVVFAVEDELRFARLWYPTETGNSSLTDIPGVRRPSKIGKGKFTERSIVSLKPNVDGELTAGQNALPGPSNHIRSHQMQTISFQHLSAQNCCLKISNHAMIAIRAASICKRITQPQNYIHSYMNMMFIFCVSAAPFYSNKQNNTIGIQKWICWIRKRLQLIIFVLLALLSAFQSFCQAKYSVLWFIFKGGIDQFVKLSFHVTSLVTSAYFSYLFCRDTEVIRKMANVIISYDRNLAPSKNKPSICIVLAIITALLASLRSLLVVDISDFSVENAMLESSFQMSEDIFLWSSHNLNITIEKLSEEFGNQLSFMETFLAIVKMFRDFAYHLQDGMMWDLIGCVVFTLFVWMNFFMRNVTEVIENVLDENSEAYRVLQQKRELVWKMYREIQIVFEAVNNVFDPLLMFYHASNVLRYAFFMENVIYPQDVNSLTYVHLLYNIVKSEVSYIMASKIAQQNKVIRKWLRNWGSRNGKINVGHEEIEMYAALDELEDEKLGLGKGDLMIHQGFHFGLLGLVSSLFVTLASKKK